MQDVVIVRHAAVLTRLTGIVLHLIIRELIGITMNTFFQVYLKTHSNHQTAFIMRKKTSSEANTILKN